MTCFRPTAAPTRFLRASTFRPRRFRLIRNSSIFRAWPLNPATTAIDGGPNQFEVASGCRPYRPRDAVCAAFRLRRQITRDPLSSLSSCLFAETPCGAANGLAYFKHYISIDRLTTMTNNIYKKKIVLYLIILILNHIVFITFNQKPCSLNATKIQF